MSSVFTTANSERQPEPREKSRDRTDRRRQADHIPPALAVRDFSAGPKFPPRDRERRESEHARADGEHRGLKPVHRVEVTDDARAAVSQSEDVDSYRSKQPGEVEVGETEEPHRLRRAALKPNRGP